MSNFYRKVAVIRDDGTVYESGRMNVVTDSANQYYEKWTLTEPLFETSR